VLCALGAGVLAAVLGGAVGFSTTVSVTGRTAAPPALPAAARPRAAAPRVASAGPVVAAPSSGPSAGEGESLLGVPAFPISAAWESGFYPIYGEAQRTFGVNWLLLASIHRQETAFSTAPTTYHGLNFAGCCGGPMQFNVTNGPVTTWDLVRRAYRFGRRPAVYDHRTARHPSIYDDFDSVMAAAWLLYSDGAGVSLDDSAWWAAYDYYGHDATGVEYADEVLARAIGWSQHGFCVDCGVEPALIRAVYAAWGAPVGALFPAAMAAHVAHRRHAGRGHTERRGRHHHA
jgi:hypothetical protein